MTDLLPSLTRNTRRRCVMITLANAWLWTGASHALASESVELTWDPSPSGQIVAYKVYVGRQSGDYQEVLTIADVSDALVSDLAAGETYYFAVAAVSASGDESELSNETRYQVTESASVASPTVAITTAPGSTVLSTAPNPGIAALKAAINRGSLTGIHPLSSAILPGQPSHPSPNLPQQIPARAPGI